MAEIIICANQKGGVAKTTTALNVGIGLARKGKKVLLIDCDPQASLTVALGYNNPDQLGFTLASMMNDIIDENPYDPKTGILRHREGVDLIPSNLELSGVESALLTVMSGETVLKELTERLRDRYDYILIDCSPNLGMLTYNALTAGDSVIIPIQAAYLPVKGLELLLKTISRIKRKINPDLKILGILITMVDTRTNYAKDIIELVREAYGSEINIFQTSIPFSVRAAETSAHGVSIYAHDPKGKVAAAYESLTEEVMHYEP